MSDSFTTSPTLQKCGEFSEPEVPDLGCCQPAVHRRDCEAPVVPDANCEDETFEVVVTDQGLKVSAKIFDEDCLPILDENSDPITTLIS